MTSSPMPSVRTRFRRSAPERCLTYRHAVPAPRLVSTMFKLSIRRERSVPEWKRFTARLTGALLVVGLVFRTPFALAAERPVLPATGKPDGTVVLDMRQTRNPVLEAAHEVEAELDARVGLAILDTVTGTRWLYNADQRFPMASTFKVLACGALLAHADAGTERLVRKVRITQADLVTYSPVTEKWVGQEVSLADLCAATLRTSDNTAANKVLDAIGGPAALTAFLRSLGDARTRLDRWETALNEGAPGDLRDTTTPTSMVATLHKLLLGNALLTASRDLLVGWLESNAVGGPLLRAGIPGDWRIADRSGAGGYGSRGVVGVMWPPGRPPIIAAIYITQTQASMDVRNTAISRIGRALAEAMQLQHRSAP